MSEVLEEQESVNTLGRIADRSAKKTFFRKRQGCPLCLDNKIVDYKDPKLLGQFISPSGRILPTRVTGICVKHQRHIKKAVKICRMIGVLPF